MGTSVRGSCSTTLATAPAGGDVVAGGLPALPGEYGCLLRIGCCVGPEFHSDEEEMLLRLAEPWFDAIRTRVTRDGLRVHCYVGYNMYTQARGAGAELLRPDGAHYTGWHKRQEHEAMMLADWGETLRLARLASPA